MTHHEILRAQAVTRFVEREERIARAPHTQYLGKVPHDDAYVAEHIRLQAERIEELEAVAAAKGSH